MPRLAHIFRRNALAAASLLFCVAAAGAWARSYWRTDVLAFHFGAGTLAVYSDAQTLMVERNDDPDLRGWETWSTNNYPGEPRSLDQFFFPRHEVLGLRGSPDLYEGCGFYLMTRSDYIRFRVGVPFYFICLAAAVLPAARARRALRRWLARPRPGHCADCGYDLRATPNRCPECGALPKAEKGGRGPIPPRPHRNSH